MCFRTILPKVILESQDILVSCSEGPRDGFFSFSSKGYLVGGAQYIILVKKGTFARFQHVCDLLMDGRTNREMDGRCTLL